MNTYRAMGVTGYLFTNDSATEKFVFQNFPCGMADFTQTKPADEGIRRQIF
ncbi:hypothetical protein GOA58_14680 [Sinorhizobium meliloti]|nr:hypothetical protein [Sinorhizobium meliloti]MDW9662128.1 hypothetical protein [Sinorhizobium meliloti]MDX0051632.1 hypothetical protein [Sinorhizobium meliloti]